MISQPPLEHASLGPPVQNLHTINRGDHKAEQPVFIPFDVNLAVGQNQTCFCESGIPDYWIASVRPIVGLKVSLFLNSNNSGIPIRLTGGGYAKLPGMSEYLTVVCETGSTSPVNVTVVAVRGYKHVEVYGGNLA